MKAQERKRRENINQQKIPQHSVGLPFPPKPMQQVKSLRRMGQPLHCHKLNVGNKGALSHRNMLDSFFPVVIKTKILFWSPVDVFFFQSSYEQVSKIFCFTALCLSFKTLSYLLVPSEIPSRILGSHPSEHDSSCDETFSNSKCLNFHNFQCAFGYCRGLRVSRMFVQMQ